jgi:hypothetical protein
MNFLSSVVYHLVSTKCTPWFTSIIELSFIVFLCSPLFHKSRDEISVRGEGGL